MSRNSLILTGLVGLIGAVVVTVLCFLGDGLGFNSHPSPAHPTCGPSFCFCWPSVTEIPVMIIGIRRIAASANPKAKYGLAAQFVAMSFLGAVYAALLFY